MFRKNIRKTVAATVFMASTMALFTACGDSKSASADTQTQSSVQAQTTQATQAAAAAAAGVSTQNGQANVSNNNASNNTSNNTSNNGTQNNTAANQTQNNQTNNNVNNNNQGASNVTSKGYKIETIDGITYVDGVMIVNKTYGLPETYGPGDVMDEVKSAFAVMQQAAAQEGLNIYISSGFRSFNTQNSLYNRYVSQDGKVKADTYSARPGHSEHQTGLCFDLNSIDDSFANTPEGIWVGQHAQEYGFIIRYPKGKENITGYQYESWHLRYLGNDLAMKVYNSGLTLEEYYGITSQYAD